MLFSLQRGRTANIGSPVFLLSHQGDRSPTNYRLLAPLWKPYLLGYLPSVLYFLIPPSYILYILYISYIVHTSRTSRISRTYISYIHLVHTSRTYILYIRPFLVVVLQQRHVKNVTINIAGSVACRLFIVGDAWVATAVELESDTGGTGTWRWRLSLSRGRLSREAGVHQSISAPARRVIFPYGRQWRGSTLNLLDG